MPSPESTRASAPPPANARPVWFPAKTYGWGWGPPVCWQGWVVLGAYIVLLVAGIVAIEFYPALRAWFILYAAILVIALLVICWRRGEKPAWRWGRPPK